jgi:hypothetical protein
MARALTFVLIPVLAGLFVTAVMASNRGADSTYSAVQRAATGPLTAAKLEALVRKAPTAKNAAPDPRARAICRPGGSGRLRNPWSCTVRYRAGQRFTYRVRVFPTGSFLGRSGRTAISGCCVEFGPTN